MRLRLLQVKGLLAIIFLLIAGIGLKAQTVALSNNLVYDATLTPQSWD